MATITASAAGGNWSATATWIGGVVPTATDDVLLASTSGNVAIDGTPGTPSTCRSLDCTGYTGTLTHGGVKYLAIGDPSGSSPGTLTLVSGMTYTPAGGSALQLVSQYAGTQQLTSGGHTLSDIVFNCPGSISNWTDALTAISIAMQAGTMSASSTITLDVFNASANTGGTLNLGGTFTVPKFQLGACTLTMNGYGINCNTGAVGTAGGILNLSGTFTCTSTGPGGGTAVFVQSNGTINGTNTGSIVIVLGSGTPTDANIDLGGGTATIYSMTSYGPIYIGAATVTIPAGASATWVYGDFEVESAATLYILGVPTFSAGSLTVAGSSPPIPSSYTFGS